MVGMVVFGSNGLPLVALNAENEKELIRLYDEYMRHVTMMADLEKWGKMRQRGIDTEKS